MQRALIWLNLYGHQAEPKNAFFVFLGRFWAYVGEPHGYIGWAKSMPFASINPTNQGTNPWNFGGNCSAFGDVEKLSFFESAILNFFFFLKFFFVIPMKISHKLCVRMDGTQFLKLWWFTAENEGRNDKIAWVYFVIKRIQIGEDSEEREPPVCFLIWVSRMNFYRNSKIFFERSLNNTHNELIKY